MWSGWTCFAWSVTAAWAGSFDGEVAVDTLTAGVAVARASRG